MSYESVQREFFSRLERVKRWDQKKLRAPHKPLLLLMAFSEIQRGGNELRFDKIEAKLADLIVEFGHHKARRNPHLPFWRLRNDKIWDVKSTDNRVIRQTASGDAFIADLRHATGQFLDKYKEMLKSDAQILNRAIQFVLQQNFAPGMFGAICEALEVTWDYQLGWEAKASRDPKFRPMILKAYGECCAVCGVGVTYNGRSIGLEAAHVQWFSFDGPCTQSNGVCLCSFHHVALDRGLISFSFDQRILVASGVQGDRAEETLLKFGAERLKTPETGTTIDEEYLDWHHKNVFKDSNVA